MNDARAASEIIRAYHQRTKHQLDRYAAGPESLDWDAQPDPFRRWQGTRRYELPRDLTQLDVVWAELDRPRPPAPFELGSVGALLRLTASITAWKQYGASRWALRAHPSSGNLHPTETWVIAYWVEGLPDGLYHYQSLDHALEWRASTTKAADAPGLWLGFSSIHWREAWKYGERAFRYCQLDMGHVLAALSYAAALLGWQAKLADLTHEQVANCLGTNRAEDYAGVEAEDAETVVALYAGESGEALPPLQWDEWSGVPSLLDRHPMYQWPVIDEVAKASVGLSAVSHSKSQVPDSTTNLVEVVAEENRERAGAIILGRRSAQAFDGQTDMPVGVFRRILASLLGGGSPAWRMWPYRPRVHPVLMVHRVEEFAPGLYAMPRDGGAVDAMKSAMRKEFQWHPADPELPLYRLIAARTERSARTLSCHQDIASMSAFILMFVAEFDGPISEDPAAYRHLHWEAGMLGHCATLQAEAAGWRGTGIGCFFDDADHEILGLSDTRYQVIYHYAIGMAINDSRLITLPAYE